MIPWRRSLRVRIAGAFVTLALILGPIVAGVVVLLTHEMEERVVERWLADNLDDVVEAPESFALRELSHGTEVQVLGSMRLEALPPALFELDDGVHEVHEDGQSWMIALRSTGDGRYAVVEDITAMEERERLGFLVVVVAVALTAYLALALGFYASRRLVAPVLRLSREIQNADDERRLADGFGEDEIGQLARSIDHYRAQIAENVRRERAFSAHASHELRNPLSVIQNAAELLEEDEDRLSARGRRALGRIQSTAGRMNETIDALLLLVRGHAPSAGSREVSLRDCIQQLMEIEQPALRALAADPEAVTCEAVFEADPRIQAPAQVVEIILRNLLRNALEHSGGSRVEVRLCGDRVAVIDDGCGMSDSASERPSSGGLGLALVQRLCDHYGWSLTIDSTPGQGTRAAWVFKPAGPEHTPAGGTAASGASRSG